MAEHLLFFTGGGFLYIILSTSGFLIWSSSYLYYCINFSMQRTQEQKKLISCLHLIFQAVRKYVIKLIDILANFICIHGGIYFFEKFRQMYFSEMCPSLSIIVMGDLSFDPVSIKPAVS